MYDCHIHSIHSFDSEQTLDELCEEAIEKGMKGISITEHVYLRLLEKHNVLNCLQDLDLDIKRVRNKYQGKLQIFCGIEVSEFQDNPDMYQYILSQYDFDIVLGSVHLVDDGTVGYAKIDFGTNHSSEYLHDYLQRYFHHVEKILDTSTFDVLSHLTCPLRYINGRYGNHVDWKVFQPQIIRILKKVIDKHIALEINSSGYTDENGYHPLPDAGILKVYYEMGGRLLTLGSDSHRNRRVGHDFEKVIKILKEIGFEYYCYYDKRKPVNVYI